MKRAPSRHVRQFLNRNAWNEIFQTWPLFQTKEKEAVSQKDQEALVWSGENIDRKDRRKKKKFFSCRTGLQWQGKENQPLATLKWQSHANALRGKAAHLLSLYTLQHNQATSWVVLVRLIRSCSNCDKQWWVHSARPCSWQSLVKESLASFYFGLNSN